MVRWSLTALGWIQVCLLSAGALALEPEVIEVDMSYQRTPDRETADEVLRPSGGWEEVEVTTKRPEGEWKLPALKSKAPAYAFTSFGGEKKLLVVDSRSASDRFFNVLYFDANGNHDLTDDKALEIPEQGEGMVHSSDTYAQFPIADTTVKIDGKEVPYAFRLFAYLERTMEMRPDGSEVVKEGRLQLMVTSECWYRGEFKVAGEPYRFLLVDGNTNARFDDVASLPKEGPRSRLDRVYPAGDGLWITAKEKLQWDDSEFFGDLLLLGQNLFRVRVDIPAKKLELKRIQEGLVEVKLSMPVERLALFAEDGKGFVVLYHPGDKVRIPPGRYRLASYQAQRKDREGDRWLIAGQCTKATAPVAVGDGGAGEIPFGEPFEASASVPEGIYEQLANTGSELKDVPLVFRLQGKAGEVVTDLRRIEGEQTSIPMSEVKKGYAKEPSYTIVKTDGRVAAQGSFKYG
jgi:hypothetical protein